MRCFQKRAPLFIVVSFLLLQACVAGAAASSVSASSSSLVKHGETAAAVHVRKLLTMTTVQAAAGMSADTAENTAAEAAPSECSEDAVEVSQSQDKQGADLPPPSPGGVGTYSVTIANTCLHCTVRDVHISCGEFGQAQLVVAPADFRRVAVGVCLVRGGGALGPGESVSFRYSSLFQYHLHVASVSCG